MSKVKELEKLLREDIMIELEDSIQHLAEKVRKNKSGVAIKDELKYMREVQEYFDATLYEIDKEKLSEDDAIEILATLEEMRLENQEV